MQSDLFFRCASVVVKLKSFLFLKALCYVKLGLHGFGVGVVFLDIVESELELESFTKLESKLDFTVCKELLIVSSFCWATKNIDIYSNLVAIVNDYGGSEKCACIVTDGVSTMTGR